MSEKFDLWPGYIPLPAMLPDGTITTVWWESDVPLPPDGFIMRERPDGTYDFVINTGVSK
jgi:hypothetical protein